MLIINYSQAHQASQVLIDWLFYVFSFMFRPSQRGKDWLDERLEAPKAYKGFSDKQYIMKAASLLEHKCFFLVFVFTGQQYFFSFKFPYAGGFRRSVGNGLETDL